MKTLHSILALLFATLLVTAVGFAADEPVVMKHKIKLKIATDGDAVDVEADDMEVGETRQFFTDSGKEVVLTREEDGMRVTLDGEDLNLDIHDEDHHGFVKMHGGGVKKVVVKKIGGGEGEEENVYVYHHGEDLGDHVWVESGEGAEVVVHRRSPATHLLESGVLDDLDEETRQKILDTLNEMEPRVRVEKRIMVDVEEEVHADGDDDQ